MKCSKLICLAWPGCCPASPPPHQNIFDIHFARRGMVQLEVSEYGQHLYCNHRYVSGLSGWPVPSESHAYLFRIKASEG